MAESTVITTVRLPRVIVEELRRLARQESESQSVVVRRIVRRGLNLERSERERASLR
jgi:hypothetical protein